MCVLVFFFISVGLCSICDFYFSLGFFKLFKSGWVLYSVVEDVVYMFFMFFVFE